MDPTLYQNYRKWKTGGTGYYNDYFKSDVFSVGITILEACLLEHPLSNIN